MEVEEIKALVELFESTTLTELELERGESRLVLKRKPAPQKSHSHVEYIQSPVQPNPGTQAAPPQAEGSDGESSSSVDALEGFAIEAPIVGTFYRRPAPEEDPYVEIGDQVKAGDTVCIVEAMKVMNEVRTDRAGIVKEILVDDNAAVEYGQALIILDTFDS